MGIISVGKQKVPDSLFLTHSTVWDAEGSIAIRFGQIELLPGEKAFHFKTSPQADQYFVDTLSGAYAGLRYLLGTADIGLPLPA